MAKGDYSCEKKEIFKLTSLAIYDRKGIANNRAVEESKKYLSPLAKRASAIITTDRVMSTLYAFQPISERSWFRKLRK
jgi:Holliday junction resolvasome RuvABC DNA-binding subunit